MVHEPLPGSSSTLSAGTDNMSGLVSRFRARRGPQSTDDQTGPSINDHANALHDGVEWVHAEEGRKILHQALSRSQSAPQQPDLARRLYIDGMIYLLRALPRDLTLDEKIRFGNTLPLQLDSDTCPSVVETISSGVSGEQNEDRMVSMELPFVRLLIARITELTIIMICLVFRVVGTSMQNFYAYDRRHQLSDRLIVQGAVFVNQAYAVLNRAISRISGMNDGEVGRLFGEISRCFIEEASGGVLDGLREALDKRDPDVRNATGRL